MGIKATEITRTFLPRNDKLLEKRLIKAGDTLVTKHLCDYDSIVIEAKSVDFHSEVMTFITGQKKFMCGQRFLYVSGH